MNSRLQVFQRPPPESFDLIGSTFLFKRQWSCSFSRADPPPHAYPGIGIRRFMNETGMTCPLSSRLRGGHRCSHYLTISDSSDRLLVIKIGLNGNENSMSRNDDGTVSGSSIVRYRILKTHQYNNGCLFLRQLSRQKPLRQSSPPL